MTTDAGDFITPPRLNPVGFQLQCNATTTLGAAASLSLTNVSPGFAPTALSYTVPEGGMAGLAVWVADFLLFTAGTVTAATVDILIDGAVPTDAPQAIWDPGNVTDGRVTLPAVWPLNLTAGVHTFGLRAAIVAGTGVVKVNAKHTNLSIWLHP